MSTYTAGAGAVRERAYRDVRTRARATGEGFCHNVGRGIGALFGGIIGFLAIASPALLPETHGRELRALE